MARHSAFYDSTRQETYYERKEIAKLITDDYIHGLIEGEGCFGNMTNSKGEHIPAFMLKMHFRDKELIEAIRDYLGLYDRVYEYTHQGRHFAVFQVRDIGELKNIIIPFFKGKLLGHKGMQFKAWIEKYPYLLGLHQR